MTEQLFHTPGLILGTHSIPWSSSVLDQLWGLVGGALKTSRLSDLRASGPYRGVSLVAQMVKNLPAMQVTWVQSLGGRDLLEKGMATHVSILPWRIPWTQ